MSGRKNVLKPYQLLNRNIDQSFVSDAVNVQYLDNIGIILNVTTTSNTGLFTIEASNDGSNFSTLELDPPIAALADASTAITVALADFPFAYIRIRFVIGTGTNGTVSASIVAKEL